MSAHGITWTRTTAARYDEMLNILPPAAWIGGAFLVGEPVDGDPITGAARFDAYWQRYGPGLDAVDHPIYYVTTRPITIAELRAELRNPAPEGIPS